jgi:hypothetical protein
MGTFGADQFKIYKELDIVIRYHNMERNQYIIRTATKRDEGNC